MNLTSKRMLQFLSVCAGAFALTAAAQNVWVSDNFEAEGAGLTNAAIGDAAGMYKANVWGGQGQFTNLVWEAGAGDASTIQAFEGSYTINSRPIAEANAQAQALKLETEGQTLTRYVAFQDIDDGSGTLGIPLTQPVPVPYGTTPVYVDTLIKFTPSEDDPEITDPSVKVAIFVNASSNLVVRHKYFDGVASFIDTNSVFEDLEINPEQWYRLTIKLARSTAFNTDVFQVHLDGSELTHYNGAQAVGAFHNGPLFFSLAADPAYGGGDQQLNQVSFPGTGYVDDLVVADTIVPFQTAGLTFTLAFNDNLLNVFDVNDAGVASNATITSGATLKIYTEDWYQINSIGGDGIEWIGDTPGELVTNVTGTISADVAGRTATIEAGLYTGTIQTGLTGTYATVPADKLASWAVANSLTLADVVANAADYLDNYLMNVGVGVNTGITITEIVYDPADGTATIKVGANASAVDFNELNGTLVVWTCDELDNANGFTEPNETLFDVTVDASGAEATVVVQGLGGKFIRAVVR